MAYYYNGKADREYIYLATPDRRILGVLNGVDENNVQVDRKAQNTDELTFTVYKYIEGEPTSWYDNIEELMNLYVDGVWYIVTEPPQINDDGENSENKTITAESAEIQLQNYDLIDFQIGTGEQESYEMQYYNKHEDEYSDGKAFPAVTFYNPENPELSLLHLILFHAGLIPTYTTYDESGEKTIHWTENIDKGLWTIGNVDNIAKTKKNYDGTETSYLLRGETYTFEVDNQDVYSFLTQDVAQAFGCIFTFDTDTRTINAQYVEHIGMEGTFLDKQKDTHVYIGWRNVQNKIGATRDNQLYTAANVSGGDNLDNIDWVNFGSSEIEDYSYFMDTKFVPQSLIDKYNAWVEYRESQRPAYIQDMKDWFNAEAKVEELTSRVPVDGVSNNWRNMTPDQLTEAYDDYTAMISGLEKQYVDESGKFDVEAIKKSPNSWKEYEQIMNYILPAIVNAMQNKTLDPTIELLFKVGENGTTSDNFANVLWKLGSEVADIDSLRVYYYPPNSSQSVEVTTDKTQPLYYTYSGNDNAVEFTCVSPPAIDRMYASYNEKDAFVEVSKKYGQGNLINNATLTTTDSWYAYPTNTSLESYSIGDTSPVYGATHEIKISNINGEERWGVYQNGITVTSGEYYMLSFYVKSASSTAIKLWYTTIDLTKEQMSDNLSTFQYSPSFTITNTWTRVYWKIMPDGDNTYTKISVGIFGDNVNQTYDICAPMLEAGNIDQPTTFGYFESSSESIKSYKTDWKLYGTEELQNLVDLYARKMEVLHDYASYDAASGQKTLTGDVPQGVTAFEVSIEGENINKVTAVSIDETYLTDNMYTYDDSSETVSIRIPSTVSIQANSTYEIQGTVYVEDDVVNQQVKESGGRLKIELDDLGTDVKILSVAVNDVEKETSDWSVKDNVLYISLPKKDKGKGKTYTVSFTYNYETQYSSADAYTDEARKNKLYRDYYKLYSEATDALIERQAEKKAQEAIRDEALAKANAIATNVQRKNFGTVQSKLPGFTDEDENILKNLYKHTDYTNENIIMNSINTDDDKVNQEWKLWYDATDNLYASAHPQYTWTSTIDQVLGLEEFKDITEPLELFSYVHVEVEEGHFETLRLIEMSYNPLIYEGDFQLVFSTITQYKYHRDDFSQLIDVAVKNAKNSISGNVTTSDVTEYTISPSFIKTLLGNGSFVNGIGTIATGSVDTTSISSDTIATKLLNADDAYISKLQTKLLSANYIQTKAISAISADFDQLLVNSSLLVQDGTATLVDGKVTGTLDAVNINADKITSGTLTTDRLIIRDKDNNTGILFAINNGIVSQDNLTEEELKRMTLNGQVITAQSITADKISVKDLSAFKATIGGFQIDDNSIHSFNKTSISDDAAGIYMGQTPDGKSVFAVGGNAGNHIIFDGDKLSIAVDSLSLGTHDIGKEIDDLSDKVSDVAQTVEVEYISHTSATEEPDGNSIDWSGTSPARQEGRYIWQRTKITNVDGSISYKPSESGVCISGVDGKDGEDAISVQIESSAGTMFKNKNVNTILTCHVYQGTNEITDKVTKFIWKKKDQNGVEDSSWGSSFNTNTITITDADVLSKAVFVCEVEF